MEMKHTPGPWEFSTDPDEPEVVAELCTSGLAHFLIVPTRDATLGDIAADARLIAAAPELLDAPVDLLHQSKLSQDEGGWDFEQAEAAIAKATGMTANAKVSGGGAFPPSA